MNTSPEVLQRHVRGYARARRGGAARSVPGVWRARGALPAEHELAATPMQHSTVGLPVSACQSRHACGRRIAATFTGERESSAHFVRSGEWSNRRATERRSPRSIRRVKKPMPRLRTPRSPNIDRPRARRPGALCLALALIVTPACMSNPRDRQVIADPQQFWVEGLLPWPNTAVSVDVSPDGANWTPMYNATASSSSTAQTDDSGQNWYRYSAAHNFGIPSLWSGNLSTHTAKLRVRTYVRGSNHASGIYDPNQDTALSSFDDNASTNGSRATAVTDCVKAHITNGFADVINNCKGSRSPIATVSTACGSSGQICCGTDGCDSGLGCGADNVCEVCGASNQPPCQDVASQQPTCNGGLQLTESNTCGTCGGNGQIACFQGYCNRGYAVAYPGGGKCQPCGAQNQPVCQQPGGQPTCNSGLKPNSTYICVGGNPPPPSHPKPPPTTQPPPCGGTNQICCSTGSSCNAGLWCTTGVCSKNPPGACDYLGEPCCFDGSTSNLSCSNTYDPALYCGAGYCVH